MCIVLVVVIPSFFFASIFRPVFSSSFLLLFGFRFSNACSCCFFFIQFLSFTFFVVVTMQRCCRLFFGNWNRGAVYFDGMWTDGSKKIRKLNCPNGWKLTKPATAAVICTQNGTEKKTPKSTEHNTFICTHSRYHQFNRNHLPSAGGEYIYFAAQCHLPFVPGWSVYVYFFYFIYFFFFCFFLFFLLVRFGGDIYFITMRFSSWAWTRVKKRGAHTYTYILKM